MPPPRPICPIAAPLTHYSSLMATYPDWNRFFATFTASSGLVSSEAKGRTRCFSFIREAKELRSSVQPEWIRSFQIVRLYGSRCRFSLLSARWCFGRCLCIRIGCRSGTAAAARSAPISAAQARIASMAPKNAIGTITRPNKTAHFWAVRDVSARQSRHRAEARATAVKTICLGPCVGGHRLGRFEQSAVKLILGRTRIGIGVRQSNEGA